MCVDGGPSPTGIICSHHNLFLKSHVSEKKKKYCVSNVIKGGPELVLNGKKFVAVLWSMNK